jgi:D-alanyl-D-alanine carboxypeptidase/D-alanyl-D-alanine-endopeptidase (penicillin-binding protein 4)
MRTDRLRVPGVAALMLLLLAGCTGGSASSAETGSVPPVAQKIMDRTPYAAARWSWSFRDLDSGEELADRDVSVMTLTGSTAKLFSVGTALDVLGPDFTYQTPVYADGDVARGTLNGDLVLKASGDIAMGGRGAVDGRIDFTAMDHSNANELGNAELTPEDPLAGLDYLAGQVKKASISRILGDVLIDDRLWNPYEPQAGPVSPIMINDNLIDLTATPGPEGEPASVEMRPHTDLFSIRNEVTTSAVGGETAISVSGGKRDAIVVSGSIAADSGPVVQVFRVPDPARFARGLFIKSLRRAGVQVDADPTGPNDVAALPSAYNADPVVTLASPPFSEYARLILKVSYNTGANSVVCLLALDAGSKDCPDGLATIASRLETAGIKDSEFVLSDGAGADPSSITPDAMVRWLTWVHGRKWADTLRDALPVLGVDGSLAHVAQDTAAKGKVWAKTGTSGALSGGTGYLLVSTKALAGYVRTADGREVVFALYVNGAIFPSPGEGLLHVSDDVARVAAAFQEAL